MRNSLALVLHQCTVLKLVTVRVTGSDNSRPLISSHRHSSSTKAFCLWLLALTHCGRAAVWWRRGSVNVTFLFTLFSPSSDPSPLHRIRHSFDRGRDVTVFMSVWIWASVGFKCSINFACGAVLCAVRVWFLSRVWGVEPGENKPSEKPHRAVSSEVPLWQHHITRSNKQALSYFAEVILSDRHST